jgi:uncharacterized protein YybS (DUF2232 family)
MARYWLLAIGTGLASAVLFGMLTTGAVPAFVLAYFTQLPVFLAGLALGVAAGSVAGAAGVLALSLAGGLIAAGFYLTMILPALVMIQKALLARRTAKGDVEWYPLGLLATWLAGLAVAALLLATVLLAGNPGGFEGAVREFVRAGVDQMLGHFPDARRAAMTESMVEFLPGLMLCSGMVMTVLNGSAAQALLKRAGHNIRPSADIAELELPGWLPIAFAVALAMGLFADGSLGYLGRNAAAVIAVPFFLAGLAVVHAMARTRDARRMILVVFYVLLGLFGWPALAVAGLGLIEQWAHLRRRFLAQV